MAIGIDFILRAKTASFTQGLATANNAIKDLKKSVREFDVGGGFKQALGVGGVIAGFRLAINHAQELRDEAKKTGRAIDDSTRSVAEYGDAIGNIISGSKNALVKGLSFFTQIGDAARRYFQDVTAEQEKSAQKMVDVTGKAAEEAEKRLAKAREENSPEKQQAAQERLTKAQNERDAKGTSAEKKLVNLINERQVLEEKLAKTGKATVAYKDLQAEIAKNEKETAEAVAEMDKDAEDRKKKRLDAEERVNKEAREELRKAEEQDKEYRLKKEKEIAEKFKPTVDQLAEMQTGGFGVGGDDPRLKARRIKELEGQAAALTGVGRFKEGLALAEKAQNMRERLQDITGGGEMLTAKNAEAAFASALAATNKELSEVKESIKGIIKAQ